MEKEVTTNEILEFLQEHGATKTDIQDLKGEIADVKAQMDDVKAQMVTKDYLDDKLADLRGDLIIIMRKQNNKFLKLVETLTNKNLLNPSESTTINKMDPFPELN